MGILCVCNVCVQPEGGTAVYNPGSDRNWLRLHKIHPLGQGEEDLHDRHPSTGAWVFN